jgi:hypothetical protein
MKQTAGGLSQLLDAGDADELSGGGEASFNLQ